MSYILRCPNGCDVADLDYPFFAAQSSLGDGVASPEMPVLVDRDGKLTNIWWDGTVGVPPELHMEWEQSDDLPYCVVCLNEVEAL